MCKIEEVEKGFCFSDRCQFCGEYGEKVEPYLCEKCRNRIFEWLNSKGWSILQKEGQRDLTASIRDVKCQERVERIFEEIEGQLIWAQVPVLDLEKGSVEWTMRCIMDEEWQTLRKREGVKL